MKANVSVAVRCRPLMGREITINRRCLSFQPQDNAIIVGDKTFVFETIFGEKSTQEEIYNSCVGPLIEGCFKGLNATVFAYGQTGSGKTHSIMGAIPYGLATDPAAASAAVAGVALPPPPQDAAASAPETAGSDMEEGAGILPRAISEVFQTAREERAAGRVVNVRVSMVEIYNDDCRDLLHPDIPPKDIIIREDRDGRIFFTGAREEAVRDAEQALFYLQQGNLNRSTAETLMNQSSSRSHAIFSLSIEVLDYHHHKIGNGDTPKSGTGKGDGSYMQAKLHLVDLAGSERAKRTGALGTRLKESVGINQGLLSLGKVIRALTSQPITHVPYRESKLTRFLQDSLGGNSRTVMLACISSADSNLHETLSTLQYAARAKAVQNKVSANIAVGVLPMRAESELQSDMESSIVLTLRAQLEQMQTDMEEMKKQSLGPGSAVSHRRDGDDAYGGGIAYSAGSDDDQHFSTGTPWGGLTRGTLSRILQALLTVRASLGRQLEMVGPIFQHGGGEQLQAADVQTCCALVDACRSWHSMLSSLDLEQQQERAAALVVAMSPRATGAATVALDSPQARHDVLRDSLRDSLQSLDGGLRFASDRDQEIEALRRELEECREDLKRDEDIFAEKIKELKMCKRRIKEMEAANQKAADETAKMRGQMKKLTSALMRQKKQFSTLQLKAAETVCAGKSPAVVRSSTESGAMAGAVDLSVALDAEDELNISLAVAMTEPDISQLMEDLEAMAREKADLERGNQVAEEKLESLTADAQIKRDEFAKERSSLLKELEDTRKKLQQHEKEMQSLVREHRSAVDEADAQRAARLDAEAECDRLRDALKRVGSQQQQVAADCDEERERREALEQQLRQVQLRVRQLEEMEQKHLKQQAESDRQSRVEAKHADEQKYEMDELRAANARLQEKIKEAEGKQKSTLQQLSEQVTLYKNKAVDAVKKLMSVEEENAKLQAQVATSAVAVCLETNVNRSVQVSETDESLSVPVLREEESQMLHTLLQHHVDHVFKSKNIHRLLHSQRAALTELKNERRALQQEMQILMRPECKQVEMLRSKVSGIDAKIRSLQQKREELEAALHSHQQPTAAAAGGAAETDEALVDSLADTVALPSPQKLGSLQLELQSVVSSLSSYQQHRGEMIDRLRSITRNIDAQPAKSISDFVKDADAEVASRLMGMQDEAETLDAEIDAVAGQIRGYEAQLQQQQKSAGGAAKEAKEDSASESMLLLNAAMQRILRQVRAASVAAARGGGGSNSKERSGFAATRANLTADLHAVSAVLLDMVAEERCKAKSNEAATRQLQQQLDDKVQDYDELVQVMQKTRRDATRRLEQQSREAEEKIAFLLQQLRTAEAARRSLEASASAAASLVGTPNMNPASTEGFSSRIGTPAAEAFLNYSSRPSSRK